MSVWKDFASAEDQKNFDLIPKGTIVRVRMHIKPGGHDDHQQGWTGGYATLNPSTGAVYLNCEFVVLEGVYARRKVWGKIGLHSDKGPEYANMGRSFIKGILNSARGVSAKDDSPQAQAARRINGFADLDGMEFVARIDVEKDSRDGSDRNAIKTAITKDHKSYPAAPAFYGTGQPIVQPAYQQKVVPQYPAPAQNYVPPAALTHVAQGQVQGQAQSAQPVPANNAPSNIPSWAR